MLGEIRKELFIQLYLKLDAEPKIANIIEKMKKKKEKVNMEKCKNGKISIR